MGHRRSPSLHIRFESFKLLDTLEIWANRRGEKIVPWARNALLRQARSESFQETIDRRGRIYSIESLELLREIAGPDAAQRAHVLTVNYLDKVKSDVAEKFD